MTAKSLAALQRALLAAGVVGLCWIPGSTPAAVTPATIIDQQVIKPNMLIVFDTSTSMMNAPGNEDIDSNEVGPDCDDGNDFCRTVGTVGRCYYAATGAMGAGVIRDTTKCHNDAECRVGYCKSQRPKTCDEDSDCSGGTCKGWCSNNNNQSCSQDSNCGGGKCRGICSNGPAGKKCTSAADCNPGEPCTVFANDFCVTSNIHTGKVKMCRIGLTRCRVDADCTGFAGDTCGPATSRMVIAKRVVSGVVAGYYDVVNFGLMTFQQSNYFPYYEVSGSIVNHDITRFLDRDQLEAFGCWTKTGGPAATCKINNQTYNRRNVNDTRYRIKTGGDSFGVVDNNWCGLWCTLATGTGFYVGSYYTYTDPQAAVASTTPLIKPTYLGKTISENGKSYIYWNVPPTIRNGGGVYTVTEGLQPIAAGLNSNFCCATCGGNGAVVPFMTTSTDPVKQREIAMEVIKRMDKASLGGITAEGFTPTGCTLYNDAEPTDTNNALSYMSKVKSTDTLGCRNNYVLLVTDGHPNSAAGEVACDSAACSAADPAGAGCTCRSVLAAQELKKKGITTYVVAFSQATRNDYAAKTANNIAKVGGTTKAYFAMREDELESSIINVIYDAAKGSYSTSPAVASSGIQKPSHIEQGTLLLDTRVDFPGWTGNLIAYDTSGGTPVVAWNAKTVSFDPAPDAAGPDFWKKRRIWTSNGTTMVPIDVDPVTGQIKNGATLKTLGLGATTAEAELVARWLLGDPTMKNPAVLGAMLNSTPIDVGPPGKSPLPGGVEFYNQHLKRPHLTYVGASDGMLHAFFTKDVTVGTTTYRAGQEAFAYIPQTMLPVILKVFAQGGQRPDPQDHIYGLANSPKVKSICVSGCTGVNETPVWKTILVMTYGWGGTEAFMLDVTNPFTDTGIKTASAPAALMWSTQYLNASQTSAYDNALGLTTSVPAFYYAKNTTKNDFRIVFGSYALDDVSGQAAKVLINASVNTGVITDSDKINPPNACDQSFGLMSDVATAKDFKLSEEGQLVAAYFGDTWGTIYRYVPTVSATGVTQTTGNVTQVEPFGCFQPIHYAPNIVQLDRERPTNRPGEIYIVQVTNSALDLETKNFPPSQMIIRRDLNKSPGVVTGDPTFGIGGKIVLTAGNPAQLCGITDPEGTECTMAMPATARPNATPMSILRQDGTGFLIFSTWYNPPVDACFDGVTYLAVHEWTTTSGEVKQRFAMKLASEPVTSVSVVNGKLLFASQGGVTDVTPLLPKGIRFTQDNGNGERMSRTGWTEVP